MLVRLKFSSSHMRDSKVSALQTDCLSVWKSASWVPPLYHGLEELYSLYFWTVCIYSASSLENRKSRQMKRYIKLPGRRLPPVRLRCLISFSLNRMIEGGLLGTSGELGKTLYGLFREINRRH